MPPHPCKNTFLIFSSSARTVSCEWHEGIVLPGALLLFSAQVVSCTSTCQGQRAGGFASREEPPSHHRAWQPGKVCPCFQAMKCHLSKICPRRAEQLQWELSPFCQEAQLAASPPHHALGWIPAAWPPDGASSTVGLCISLQLAFGVRSCSMLEFKVLCGTVWLLLTDFRIRIL